MGGKYPSRVENSECWVGFFMVKFRVRLFSSKAIMNPAMEINRAVVFMYHGIVMVCRLVGGMLYDMKNPASMLPNARRLMGLMRLGLFSLIMISGGYRGFVMHTK